MALYIILGLALMTFVSLRRPVAVPVKRRAMVTRRTTKTG